MSLLPWLVLTAGIGLPELVHLEVGAYVAPRFDVHARLTAPLLQPALGAGVRFHAGRIDSGRPPRWSATGALDVTLNPAHPAVFSRGEQLGFAAYPMIGAQHLSDTGFVGRLEVGAILELEDRSGFPRVGGGPGIRLAVGLAF